MIDKSCSPCVECCVFTVDESFLEQVYLLILLNNNVVVNDCR